ncbi:MAG: hypothetical protein CSA21_00290 [Deltaproteobacteria bacterium]|nr:MAG: hypothetical protein CSA21_00290 [Deltaproteobacteria bacterium]
MDFSKIDRLHSQEPCEIDKKQLHCVYKNIRKYPLKYFLANKYFLKFVVFAIIPLIFFIYLFNLLFISIEINKYIELIFVIFMIWIFYNKNTCYVFIKVIMIIYSFMPFINTYYLVTGRLISYKNVRFLLFIFLFFISTSTVYQLITE